MGKKLWTIIMYLNGTNELGVEMENTFMKIKRIKDLSNINIVVQIGKAPIELVNIIRQKKFDYKEDWTGVRRYSLNDTGLTLHDEFKNLNMADYKNLNKFIQWSMDEFPAERYMVVLSGHGFIVASLSELCTGAPYVMGAYEMCKALNEVQRINNRNIDILLLDICNMNTVELMYELGKNKINVVNYIMTYINNGPLEGLNYSEVIRELNDSGTEDILKNIIKSNENKIVSAKITHGRLKKIRAMANKISYLRLQLMQQKKDSMKDEEYRTLYLNIEINIRKLVIANSCIDNNKSLIHLIFYNKYGVKDIDAFTKFYYKLAFTKNNYCSNIIANKNINKPINIGESEAKQEILDYRDIKSIVQLYNSNNDLDIDVIVKEIYKYLKWN